MFSSRRPRFDLNDDSDDDDSEEKLKAFFDNLKKKNESQQAKGYQQQGKHIISSWHSNAIYRQLWSCNNDLSSSPYM